MGRVVTALRWQVKCYRQAGLALREQEFVARIGFFCGAEAGILTDGPEAAVVAIGEDAARERVLAGSTDVLRVYRAGIDTGGYGNAAATDRRHHRLARANRFLSLVHHEPLDRSFSEAAQ